jgi:hypothetical protein
MSTSTEDRALKLLGQGFSPEVVASSIGVSVSRISQLLSEDEFAKKVTELRFMSLSKHNERDGSYDEIEDQLIKKLKDVIPYMMKPMEIVHALTRINAAKRRGSGVASNITEQQTVVSITLPTQIINNFVVNSNNQITKVGERNLVTIQSGNMASLLEKAKQNVLPAPTSQ